MYTSEELLQTFMELHAEKRSIARNAAAAGEQIAALRKENESLRNTIQDLTMAAVEPITSPETEG